MPSNGQMKSVEQRDRYVALMVDRSPDEFRMLFKYKKSEIENKRIKWDLIVQELNSLPGAQYELDTWRHVWEGMRYWVRKRCQKFNDPEVNLKSMTPLEQWELGMMSLYDITVPESIMNWTGNVDQSDPEPESSSGSESGTESEADEPPATTSSPTPPRLPNSRFQDAVLLHCFSAFPQACPPRGRDDRWNRFVDILNLLGPPVTSIEWKAMINSCKSTVAAATKPDANWSTLEDEVAKTLRPDEFGAVVNKYPVKTTHPLLQSQMEVLLYYLEHHPSTWSPDFFPDANLWPELSGLLNVLGPTSTLDEHKQLMVTLRKSIRSKVPIQMTANERQLDNLHQRTAARMPRSGYLSRNHDMYQFCGQVSVRLCAAKAVADNHAASVTTDVACDAPRPSNDILYSCMRCLPPTHWFDAQSFEQHLAAMHYAIETVFVKIEPSDVIVEQRHPLDTLDEEAASVNTNPTLPLKRTYPNQQRAISSTAVEPIRHHFDDDDDVDVIHPVPDHNRIEGDTAVDLLHCDICKQSFQGKWLLSIHMRLHVREATYMSCGVCDLLLRTRPEWRRHRERHHIDTDTRCDECDMRFVQALHRGAHFKRAHMLPMDNQLANAWTLIETTSTAADDQQQRGEWECDQRPCQMSFDRRTALREHLLGVHGCAALRFDQQAGRVVDVLYGYTRRASQRKMYRCNMCHLQSPALSSMHHHLLLHGDQKPYMCSRCPQTFRKATELKRHRRVQHGGGVPEVSFVCETCGLEFMEKRYLEKHRRLHTGERPFQCSAEGCGMAFRRSVERRKHYLAEHYEGKLAFPCQHCRKTFKVLSDRANHMRKRHADVLQSAKADRDMRSKKKKRWNPKLEKLV